MTRRTARGPHPAGESPLLGLPGIGPARAEAYAAAGLRSRRDLLHLLPVRYRVRPAPGPIAALVDGQRGAVAGEVLRTRLRRRGRASTVSVLLRDAAGDELAVLLFNRAYLARALSRGTRLWAAGRAEVPEEGRPRLLAADHETLPVHAATALGGAIAPPAGGARPAAAGTKGAPDRDGSPGERLLPIYRLPAGVPPRVHRKAVAAALAGAEAAGELADWRTTDPGEPSLAEALAGAHAPATREQADAARRRLARDEALALSLQVAARRREQGKGRAPALALDDELHARLLGWLPHAPTAAQSRVLDQLRADLTAPTGRPMARLLQGDVGSGKTLVALYALLAAVACGRQAALMAPTEILAVQHAATLRAALEAAFGVDAPELALVVGGAPPAQRRAAREALASGAAKLAVGTHGLQARVLVFDDLAVTVVDEQHRFGVRQRVRFRTKGTETHLLVMTATPIPRTLALTAYGELDVSLIDELPPGRAPRETRYVVPSKQRALWRTLAAALAAGERGYVVCPTISGGDDGERVSVERMQRQVAEALGPDVSVGAVHGRLPAEERDAVLDAFRAGAVQVLVATVLIEVGLDVPEATFVVVPDPSRFGLATLHQIRGRVGRGLRPGRCYLLGPLPTGSAAAARVRALVQSDDGFVLAEEDLRLRGPGELLGTRQSGLPGFLVLDPVGDVDLLASTRAQALALAEGLSLPELAALRERAFPTTQLVQENLLAGG